MATLQNVQSRPLNRLSNMSNAASIYCTYFDQGYLSRGLTLIQSLRKNGDNSLVVVLALDRYVSQYFSLTPTENVRVITLQDLEAFEPRLIAVKPFRSTVEYYFTCTPVILAYAMDHFADDGDLGIYLDADLFFFASPTQAIKALGEGSIGIIEHRYEDRLNKKLSKYGRFNVGMVIFRQDSRGRALLDWYRDSCISWCHDYPEEGKYADQGYLDQFPEWPGCKVLESPGYNLAPWNLARHEVTITSTGDLYIDYDPLLFFHFHGLRKWGARYISAEFVYRTTPSDIVKNYIYKPYIKELGISELTSQKFISGNRTVKKRGRGIRGAVHTLIKQGKSVLALAMGSSIKA